MTAAEPLVIASEGVPAYEPPDEEEVYNRAVIEWEKRKRLEEKRNTQYIEFIAGPVCIAFPADQHFGDAGVDVIRAFDEIELVNQTPGMYLGLVGDLVNNFILSRMRQIRDKARFSIMDEWALVRRYLRIAAPKLLFAVSGNHDFWTEVASGIDYFREVLADVRPDCIYDADDARITIRVDGIEFPGRIRHKWRGFSIYNPTHGIERASKWDHDFLWAVSAHSHRGSYARSFNVAGLNGMAVQLGSYKRHDDYARQGGFSKHNATTAAAIIFDPELECMVGFDNIEMAAKVMRTFYGRG